MKKEKEISLGEVEIIKIVFSYLIYLIDDFKNFPHSGRNLFGRQILYQRKGFFIELGLRFREDYFNHLI